ncbi:MAG TPA: fatty acid-binding protein DegV [Clostridiales bacterium]|mgnify:CR=1 FL=1|jgi:DegV family protein with EDD domain|nr:fatty acid-binding protein DegV [Clostridiales bacterium]HBR09026.1 fatty acid-binding protein DegV [Clostridiales bacterium]
MYRIYTDSSANLPEDLIRKYDLGVIPFHYTIDGVEHPAYGDGGGFDGRTFYDAMRNGADVYTSMINTDAFCSAFEKSLSAGVDVLYIGMSSGISGAYHASLIAERELREKYPERKMAMIDTRAASLGEGLPVLHAARLKKAGASFEEAADGARGNSALICQYFTVEDLIYLKKGGRISGAAAFVGNILQIKPILKGDENGKIVLHRKERGRKRALETLAEKYRALVSDHNLPAGIAHADNEADAESLAGRLRELGLKGEILTVCYEPVTGSHVGPGTIALFFYGIHR